jgi:enterochelin esterase-like enzyme
MAVLLVVTAAMALAGGVAVATANRAHAASAPAARVGRAAVSSVPISCPSPALGGRLPALVSLPAGYGTIRRRYPVVYFLHGLPATHLAYLNWPFVAASLATSGRPAIVVQPQGVRSDNDDREYLNWGPGEDWPKAIGQDLVRCIDARYQTIPTRFGRVLAGLSAGGYGAMNIGLRALATFGAVESWSGYFAATNPAGTAVLDLGSASANAAAAVPTGAPLKAVTTALPSLIAFYVGDQDSRFLTMNRDYAAALTAAGVAHTFRVYPGGHSGALWEAHASAWLGMALDALQAEARHRAASRR